MQAQLVPGGEVKNILLQQVVCDINQLSRDLSRFKMHSQDFIDADVFSK